MTSGGLMRFCDHLSQCQIWPSVPQMPVLRTRMSTSVGPIVGLACSFKTMPGPGASLIRARIGTAYSGGMANSHARANRADALTPNYCEKARIEIQIHV